MIQSLPFIDGDGKMAFNKISNQNQPIHLCVCSESVIDVGHQSLPKLPCLCGLLWFTPFIFPDTFRTTSMTSNEFWATMCQHIFFIHSLNVCLCNCRQQLVSGRFVLETPVSIMFKFVP